VLVTTIRGQWRCSMALFSDEAELHLAVELLTPVLELMVLGGKAPVSR